MILLDLSYDFGENEILFVKIGARVPDIWLDKILWAQVAEMQFIAPRPQGHEIFEISWLYWIHIMILGPSCPKLVLGPRSQISQLWNLKIFSCQVP